MKMNFLEKVAMNNPVRACFQKFYEMPLLKKIGGRLDGLNVLEIGCGRGVGTRLIFEQLGANRVVATDFDETMIKKAKKRFSNMSTYNYEFRNADATQLQFLDGEFDAVINFAAIHHINDWQKALSEIYRVLKPNGRFYFQEVTEQWILRWPYRFLFKHPMENRFSGDQFVSELKWLGFCIDGNWQKKAKGDFIYGVVKK